MVSIEKRNEHGAYFVGPVPKFEHICRQMDVRQFENEFLIVSSCLLHLHSDQISSNVRQYSVPSVAMGL